ncbi:MAG: hypothetical protein R3F44_17235 [Candidatus Competibacteraceae bacterium]
MDFFSVKELTAQIGHGPQDWPLVVIKELMDNAIDACEDQAIPPVIHVEIDDSGIVVTDNGPGIAPDTVVGILDYSIRVSSREAYVASLPGRPGQRRENFDRHALRVLDGDRARWRSRRWASITPSPAG